MPRRPGTMVRATCCVCGAVEMASGATKFSRCSACKNGGRYASGPVRYDPLGRTTASALVQREVREGRLAHPSQLRCADCGCVASEYEHRDYNKPLCVEPICRSCNLKRGPAIPVYGSLETVIARGYVPYSLRLRAIQLFQRMGLPTDVFSTMPSKLSNKHWRELAPFIASMPATATEKAA